MRNQKNTPEVQKAIGAFITQNGKNGAKMLADACGVSEGSVSKWVNGVTKSFESDTWGKLQPEIQKHIENYAPTGTTVAGAVAKKNPAGMAGQKQR